MLILVLLVGWVVPFDTTACSMAPYLVGAVTGECCNIGVVNRSSARSTLTPGWKGLG